MVDEFNAISAKLGEEYTDELMEQMTKLQEQIDAADAWDIDSKIEMAMEALRCPPGELKRERRSRRLPAMQHRGPKPRALTSKPWRTPRNGSA